MPDLNEWRLEYGAITYEFGYSGTSEVPLRVQVDVTDPDRVVQDAVHPNSDGKVMGIDRLGGMILTFDCQVVPDNDDEVGEKTWDRPLDLYGAFKAAWRFDGFRNRPGYYATLTNLDRGRTVYGRPRKCVAKLARIRKRETSWLADFHTVDPNFYAADPKTVHIDPGGGVTTGFTFPMTAPFGADGVTPADDDVDNDGNVATWPVIEFTGPGTQSVELLQGPTVLWKLQVPSALRYDQVLRIDTRPWQRGVILNGAPANGLVRGTQIENCMVPVGAFTLRYKTNDLSGQASVDMEWRDAFTSL